MHEESTRIGLARVVRPLLDHLALQRIELQVEDLAEVHNDTPVDLFPPKCAGEV